MKIQIKRISLDAKIPSFALVGDAGMDLYADQDLILQPGERASVKTGLAIKIPAGFAGLIWDKGGLSHRKGIKTLGGVFDSGYTGEWLIGLINLSNEDYPVKKGEKIAQVLFQKIERPEMEIVDELEETQRGEQGFGSTGSK